LTAAGLALLCLARLSFPPDAAPEPSPSPDPPPTESVTRLDAGSRRVRPRPSDPWSLARDVPGVVLDRVDVGGSETAQQSLLVSRGDPGSGAGWTLDGIDVTDPAALGFAALFPDAAMADAVEVRTHTADPRVRTPGVQVAITLPRPGDRWAGGASAAGSLAQSDNLPDALADRPFARSRTRSVRAVAADAGGPLAPGRAWGWAGVARRSLEQTVFTGHDDRLTATSFAGKARLRLGGAELALLALRAEKVDRDRDPTLSADPEARWRQDGPSHLVALEARGTWGRVALRGRASALRSGFDLAPRGGTGASAFEDFRGIARRSYATIGTDRDRDAAAVEVSLSARAAGFAHRLAAGAGHARSRVRTVSAWPGNGVLGFERGGVFFRAFELTGFAIPTRGQAAATATAHTHAWLADEARRGRLALGIAVRLDRQSGRNLAASVGPNPEFPDLLPGIAYPGGDTRIRWRDILPRAAASFDLDPAGRTAVGLDYAEYGATLAAGDAGFDSPLRDVASLTYYWIDDGDRTVEAGELDLLRGRVGAGGVDPEAPASATSPHAIDPGLRAPRTRAFSVAARHRGGRWTARAQAYWRRHSRLAWRPLRGLTLGDYAIRGAVAGEIHGEPYSVGYFAPAGAVPPGHGRRLANRGGYHQDAFGVEAAAAARVRGVRLEAWAALTDWRERFTDRGRAVQDPTSTESEPLIDAGAAAARPGGLGRADVVVNARLTGGATASAALPLGLEVAVLAHAREGFPIPYYQVADTGDPTAGAKAVLVSPRLDAFRLPALVLLDARLARPVSLGRATLTAYVDVFNALDAATTLQAARDVDLPSLDRPREIVRPRIVHAGVALRF
jgi:hypothetical protein